MQPEIHEEKPRQGLAITSLVLGLISLLDLGWAIWKVRSNPCGLPLYYFSWISIAALLLGDSAWKKAKRSASTLPSTENQPGVLYGGKRMAIGGVIACIPALFFSLGLPVRGLLQEAARLKNEGEAIKSLRTIRAAQSRYQVMNGRFGTLEELQQAGLLDEAYAGGKPVSGYIYSSSEVSAGTYCVRAIRVDARCGDGDFILCEDGTLRYVESNSSQVPRRGDGRLLPGVGAETPDPVPTQRP